MQRAAVLIGVSKTGGLPELQAVQTGIAHMLAWAATQGIGGDRLVVLTDQAGKVRAHQIVDAIEKLVEQRTLDQLVVYFSGHGIHNRGDYWLLSDAPVKTAEAVNVEGSIQLARYCGVEHVVLLSDACRTAADGIQAQGVTGAEIFPNDPVDGLERKVDAFFACARGKPALEVRDPAESAGAFSALYTEVLSECLAGRHAAVLDRVEEAGAEVGLVRAWKLGDELLARVPPRLKAKLGKTPTVNQTPVARVLSREAWLSRIPGEQLPRVSRGAIRTPAAAPPAVTAFDTADKLLSTALAGDLGSFGSLLGNAPGGPGSALLRSTTGTLASPFGPTHYETGCGFKLRGARVRAVHSTGAAHEILDQDGTLVRITPQHGAVSVLLELSDGRGVLLPAIPEFLAELTFEDDELAHVAYEPSDLSPRWNDYAARRDELRALRAAIAAAAGMGVFRLTGDNALHLARGMQIAKSIDPSMALYAAYAYHDLGRRDRIREMQSFLRGDLGITFFDIALLAADDSLQTLYRDGSVLPPVPLLSQGWSLLSAFRAPVSQALLELQRYLRPSLWTLFDPAGTQALVKAFRQGEIRR
ncbi:MAG TPA: caspase family protein [Thermoanaerobaculia bacterium]|nr:caspase family protein [Thermoanaerobaculia bacterium]